jgi:hypothetical protein
MSAPTDEDAAMTAVASPRRTTRLIGLAGACALAVLSLSGCLKLDADLTVNADATASGTLAIEFQKEAAGFLGISDMASFEENFSGEELGAEGLDQFTQCTTSETDAAYVYTCTFENEVFEGTDGPWSITKEGDLLVLKVVNEGQEANPDDSLDLLGGANLGSITVAATFPGPITAVSGTGVEKTSDNSATISGSLTESIDASVTAESSGGGFSISALLVVLLAVAVLALIVIVIVVLLLRRRKGPQDEAAAPVDGGPVAPMAAAAATGAVIAETMPAADLSETTATVTEETVTETTEIVTEAVPTEVVEVTETTEIAETVTEFGDTVVVETVAETTPTEVVETVAETTPTEVVETVVETTPTEVVETVTETPADPETPPA